LITAITPTAFSTRRKKDSARRALAGAFARLGHQIAHADRARFHARNTTPGSPNVPQYVKELVFVVKRYYKPEWGDNWREHFSVDIINGTPGNELKCDNRKLVTTYLRVGFDADGAWRTFGLRKDFHPAVKIQMEDDITASVLVPAARWKIFPAWTRASVAEVREELRAAPVPAARRRDPSRLRQADGIGFRAPDNFFSNYEPLTPADARELVEDAIGFNEFTEPMQALIRESPRPASRIISSPPPIRASWTASRAKIRATCKSVPTW
jgi:hypothetical protein